MYTVKCLDLNNLTPEKKKKYSLLLPPRNRSTLEGLDPDDVSFMEIIAVGLELHGEPVGIIIAGDYAGIGLAEIYTFNILAEHRIVEYGKSMLQMIENECCENGAIVLNYFFRKTNPIYPFIEGLLQTCEWSEPTVFMERYFFDCYTFNPPWYDHPPKLPSKYKLFPWRTLKKVERAKIEKDYYQGHFSESVYPFQKEETLEKENSLGIRCKGKVIGWCITHRVAPDTVKYTALYMKPEFQFLGYSIRLLVESIKLQQKSPIRWSLFELNLGEVDRSWVKFVRRRLAPYAIAIDTLYQSWKALTPDAFTLNKK